MMKRYKNGKFFDVPEEEAAKIRALSKRHKVRTNNDSVDYEEKIKTLEIELANVLAKLNEKSEDETPYNEPGSEPEPDPES